MAGSTAMDVVGGGKKECHICLRRFLEQVLESFAEKRGAWGRVCEVQDPHAFGSNVLRHAFKVANEGVYESRRQTMVIGQRLVSLFGLIVLGGTAITARCGAWSGYLLRSKRVFPFFEDRSRLFSGTSTRESLIGAGERITVETASCPLEGGDVMLFFSRYLSQKHEIVLGEECVDWQAGSCAEVTRAVFMRGEVPTVTFSVSIGQEAFYLGREAFLIKGQV